MTKYHRLSCYLLCLSLLASGVKAQDVTPAPDAPSLFEQGLQLLLRGFAQELEPAIDGMGEALREMEPKLQELLALIDDLSNYESPRRLQNGDILIPRRKNTPELSPHSSQNEIEL